MKRADLRLELLKLCYRPDKSADQIIVVARDFEKFVEEEDPVTEPALAAKNLGGRPVRKK